MNFKFTKVDGEPTVLVVVDNEGNMHRCDSRHSRWDDIKQAIVMENLDAVLALINPEAGFEFKDTNNTVTVDSNGQTRIDNTLVDGRVGELLRAAYRGTGVTYRVHDTLNLDVETYEEQPVSKESRSLTPLMRFAKRAMANPNVESVSQLFDWLDAAGMYLTTEGKFLGYKGVTSEGASKYSGQAYVDGEYIKGQIPNPIGSIISMNREDVTFDPNTACGPGLHVGAWDYASSWGMGGLILIVEVDPRHVVSVPTDAGFQKLRVSQYKVLADVDAPELENEGYEYGYSEWDDYEDWEDLEAMQDDYEDWLESRREREEIDEAMSFDNLTATDTTTPEQTTVYDFLGGTYSTTSGPVAYTDDDHEEPNF